MPRATSMPATVCSMTRIGRWATSSPAPMMPVAPSIWPVRMSTGWSPAAAAGHATSVAAAVITRSSVAAESVATTSVAGSNSASPPMPSCRQHGPTISVRRVAMSTWSRSTPCGQRDRRGAMQQGTKPKDMKLFPRNLTARADYVVRGNPVTSRPESGADNSHPGLEFDQRNLDRGFFPGLLFDFQFGVGARLAAVRSPWLKEEKELDKDHSGAGSLSAKDGEFFLWYIRGIFGDQPGKPTVADVYGLDGYDVLGKVHDLEPGPIAVIVGVRPEKLKVDTSVLQVWLQAALLQLQAMNSPPAAGPVEQHLNIFRASD